MIGSETAFLMFILPPRLKSAYKNKEIVTLLTFCYALKGGHHKNISRSIFIPLNELQDFTAEKFLQLTALISRLHSVK